MADTRKGYRQPYQPQQHNNTGAARQNPVAHDATGSGVRNDHMHWCSPSVQNQTGSAPVPEYPRPPGPVGVYRGQIANPVLNAGNNSRLDFNSSSGMYNIYTTHPAGMQAVPAHQLQQQTGGLPPTAVGIQQRPPPTFQPHQQAPQMAPPSIPFYTATHPTYGVQFVANPQMLQTMQPPPTHMGQPAVSYQMLPQQQQYPQQHMVFHPPPMTPNYAGGVPSGASGQPPVSAYYQQTMQTDTVQQQPPTSYSTAYYSNPSPGIYTNGPSNAAGYGSQPPYTPKEPPDDPMPMIAGSQTVLPVSSVAGHSGDAQTTLDGRHPPEKKPKKVLAIVDPTTNSTLNKDDVEAAENLNKELKQQTDAEASAAAAEEAANQQLWCSPNDVEQQRPMSASSSGRHSAFSNMVDASAAVDSSSNAVHSSSEEPVRRISKSVSPGLASVTSSVPPSTGDFSNLDNTLSSSLPIAPSTTPPPAVLTPSATAARVRHQFFSNLQEKEDNVAANQSTTELSTDEGVRMPEESNQNETLGSVEFGYSSTTEEPDQSPQGPVVSADVVDAVDSSTMPVAVAVENDAKTTVEPNVDDTQLTNVSAEPPVNVSLEEGEVRDVTETSELDTSESSAAKPPATAAEGDELKVDKAKLDELMASLQQIRVETPTIYDPVTQEGDKSYPRAFMNIYEDMVKLVGLKPKQLVEEMAAFEKMPKDEAKAKGHALFLDVYDPLQRGQQSLQRQTGGAGNYRGGVAGRAGGQQQGFAVSWMPQSQGPGIANRPSLNRDRYGGRSSQGKQQNRRQQPQVVARPSIQREEVKLHSVGENAWKGIKKTIIVECNTEEEKLNKTLANLARGILNKITPDKFKELSTDFLNLPAETNDHWKTIIDILFEKAVDEPHFSKVYSELCDTVVQKELNAPGSDNKKSNFRDLLLQRCQQVFDARTEAAKDECDQKQKEIDECQDDKRKQFMMLELDHLKNKERRRIFGNIRFIGVLYQRGLLVSSIMQFCMVQLLKNYQENEDEEALECGVKLLSTIGQKLEKEGKGNLNWPVEKIVAAFEGLRTNVCNRIKFMIDDLVDQRKNGWKERRKELGPKTVKEIHAEAAMEKQQRQAQTLEHEEKKRQQQQGNYGGRDTYGGGGGRRGGPPPLRPSPSLEARRGQNMNQGGVKPMQMNVSMHEAGRDARLLRNHLEPNKVSLGGGAARWRMATAQPQTGLLGPQSNRRMPGIVGRGSADSKEALSSASSSRDGSRSRHDGPPSDRQSALDSVRAMGNAQPRRGGVAGMRSDPAMDRHQTPPEQIRSSPSPAPATIESNAAGASDAKGKTTVDWEKRYKGALEQLTTCVRDQNELRDADVQSIVETEDLLQAGESTADGIKHLLTFALNKSAEKTHLCAGRLVNRLLNEEATQPHIAKGFSDYMTHAIEEDMPMDLPNLWNWLGSILAMALIYGSSPPNARLSDFGETFEKTLEADPKYAEKLLAQFLLAVVKQGGDTALVNLFAREASDEGRRLDIYVPQLVAGSDAHSRFFDANPPLKCLLDDSASVVSSSQETLAVVASSDDVRTLISDSPPAAESDVESSSSTDKLKQQLLELERRMQHHGNTEDSQRFIEDETDFIDQNFTAEQRNTPEFFRSLVRGICQTVLTGSETAQHHVSQDDESTADADDDGNQQVDEALFQERFKNLLIRYVDADSEGEDAKRLCMLDAFAEQVQNRGCPQGLIAEIFEVLNKACVVSLDTCKTWRSRAQQKGTYAMILCDGGLKMMLLAEDEEQPQPQ